MAFARLQCGFGHVRQPGFYGEETVMIEKHLEKIRAREEKARSLVRDAEARAEEIAAQALERGEKLLEEVRITAVERERELIAEAKRGAEARVAELRSSSESDHAALRKAADKGRAAALDVIVEAFRDV
jgi:vacuolar-type H+-ATPase subunit H